MGSFPTPKAFRKIGGLGLLLLAAIALVVTACSAFLNSDTSQCSTNADCARFPNTVCNTTQNVCVPITTMPDASGTDAGSGCWDEAGFGGAGCYSCTPTTNDQLLNACVPYAFGHFDNAKRIAGFDPANPRPALPGVDAGVDAGIDSGFDAGIDASGDAGGDAGVDAAPPPPPPDAGLPACPLVTSLPNPVIVVGSTGLLIQPTLDAMGVASGKGAAAVTMIMSTVGSCDGVNSMEPDGPKAARGTTVTIFRPETASLDCTLQDGDWPADIGAGGLFWDSCNPGVIQPPDFEDFVGPVNPVGFIVPHASTEGAISAEAAYKVYGFGAQSGVAPWTDDGFIWRRNPTSANQTCVSKALLVPVDRFQGQDSHGGANLVKNVANTPVSDADKTVGLSSSEVVDPARTTVTLLAYQHYGQRVGFFWDADPAAFDRKPVRDGHYFMWLPIHVFAHIDNSGTVVGAPGNRAVLDGMRPATLIGDLVDYLTIRRPLPDGRDVLAAMKDPNGGAAAIPACAMHVTRSSDSGPLKPFTPPHSCDCAFEAAPPGSTPAGCIKCQSDADCASSPRGQHCSFGYCEAN